MSTTLWILVGQGGNQVGRAVVGVVAENLPEECRYAYLHADGSARVICADSEAKVVATYKNDELVRDSCVVVGGVEGRGNNWAYGYRGSTKGREEDSLLNRTLARVRKEVETTTTDAFVVVHSLGGGTGSGFGSRIIETLRDTYPLFHIVSAAVFPFTSGDTPLQHYNCLLSLNKLSECTDCVVAIDNDAAAAVAAARRVGLSGSGGKQTRLDRPTKLSDINNSIASAVAGVVLPVCSGTDWQPFNPSSLVTTLTPLPSLKFVTLYSTKLSRSRKHAATQSWKSVVGALDSCIPSFTNSKSVMNSLYVRGDAECSWADYGAESINKVLAAKLPRVSWNAAFSLDTICSAAAPVLADPGARSLTLATNSTAIADTLANVYERALAMFTAGAYLHWYSRFGTEETDFDAAFSALATVIDSYDTVE